MPGGRFCVPVLRRSSCESNIKGTGLSGCPVNSGMFAESGLCDKLQKELAGTIPESGAPGTSTGYGSLQSFVVTRVSDVTMCLTVRDLQLHASRPDDVGLSPGDGGLMPGCGEVGTFSYEALQMLLHPYQTKIEVQEHCLIQIPQETHLSFRWWLEEDHLSDGVSLTSPERVVVTTDVSLLGIQREQLHRDCGLRKNL